MRGAVFCMPATGHLNPLLALARELTRRGVELELFCTEARRPAIEAAGARFRHVPELESLETTDSSLGLFWFAEKLAELTRALTPGLVEQLRAGGHDFVLHDCMAPWGRFASKGAGLPAIASYCSFASNPAQTLLPPIPLLLAVHGLGNLPANLARLRRRREAFAELLARYGVDERGFGHYISSPGGCNLVFTSREFQVKPERLDDTFHFVGPTGGTPVEVGDFPLEALEGRKVVYVSMGTVFNTALSFFRRCAEAFSDGFQVVMAVGNNNDPAAVGPVPEGVIVRRFVPQAEIVQRAALFVTHGGFNSVHDGMRFRVPMLVMPQGADQFLIADRVQALGLGRRLGPGLPSAARLRKLGEAVMNDASVRARLEENARVLGPPEGAARGAELAMEYLRRVVPLATRSVGAAARSAALA